MEGKRQADDQAHEQDHKQHRHRRLRRHEWIGVWVNRDRRVCSVSLARAKRVRACSQVSQWDIWWDPEIPHPNLRGLVGAAALR